MMIYEQVNRLKTKPKYLFRKFILVPIHKSYKAGKPLLDFFPRRKEIFPGTTAFRSE